MQNIAGKVSFITGGASGIGLGMAEAFGAAGMKIAIADIDEKALERSTAVLLGQGIEAVGIQLDVADATSWEIAAARVERELGPVDVLCNNAGVQQGRMSFDKHLELKDVPEQLWRLIMEINVTGVFLGIRTFTPGMIERGKGGHVVNTASMAGFLAPPGLAVYVASKFAVTGLSECAAGELAPHGIGLSIVCPGGVQSNLVETTAALRAGLGQVANSPAATLLTQKLPHPPKMSPRNVGERVLRAVRENELYVFTHPEYKALVDERFAAVNDAFGESAEPGYADTAAMLERSRSRIYAAQAERRGQQRSSAAE
jgi:NAD(P)-dependent dehydrogenase (short-subunit alcohol dehydrogenase family)